MKQLVIVLLICFQYTLAQKTEQTALKYLLANLYQEKIQFQDTIAGFNVHSNKIWYTPSIIGGKGKVQVSNAIKSSVDHFYKIVHHPHDIHIMTIKAIKSTSGFIVPFLITTNFGFVTKIDVVMDSNLYQNGFIHYSR